MAETVVILGASDKPTRYAYKAMQSLTSYGHQVLLVNPFKTKIEEHHCHDSVCSITEQIDTITLYVNPKRFQDHIDDVIATAPKRVIMNPGTEDDDAEKMLKEEGIEVLRACTLVMLATNQY
jgi:predicted CoA-binding protein